MKVVEGDLLKLAIEGVFDVIVHGCNCQCVMGAGIAKAIKKVFPDAYAADRETAKGEREKLGTISSAKVTRGGREITVVVEGVEPSTSSTIQALHSVLAGVWSESPALQEIPYPINAERMQLRHPWTLIEVKQ